MAEVVCGDEPCAGCFREMQERFVVGIEQTRWLHRWELETIGGLADRVQIAIHFVVREMDGVGVAFQDLLVFEQQVIAEHEPPFAAPELLQNLECRTAIREE